MKAKCYMCSKESSSQEHVPPKCLFPEKKDLPEGVDLRKNLIKVPSCDTHNITKSHDDEFLLYCLCMNIANNSVAFRQFTTKVMRAYKRRPSLMQSFLNNSHDVIAVDKNGEEFSSLMVKVDVNRINACFDKIARAIYFYEFKRQFAGHCVFLHDWMIEQNSNTNILDASNDEEIAVLEYVKEYFREFDPKGSNPTVFNYHFDEPDSQGQVALRMQFYGGSNVFIALIPYA